jgi:hypothetical protein
MSDSKIGWCEALVETGAMSTKVISNGKRKKYKYYNWEGKQRKRINRNDRTPNQLLKNQLHEKVRAYNRDKIYKALIFCNPDEIDFKTSKKDFSDIYHFD